MTQQSLLVFVELDGLLSGFEVAEAKLVTCLVKSQRHGAAGGFHCNDRIAVVVNRNTIGAGAFKCLQTIAVARYTDVLATGALDGVSICHAGNGEFGGVHGVCSFNGSGVDRDGNIILGGIECAQPAVERYAAGFIYDEVVAVGDGGSGSHLDIGMGIAAGVSVGIAACLQNTC